ncbi:hypothetical protein [Candidatus Poriferisodalis sp.]|uniref:hypothetical protein n=1 Tax=Candidatus Poriferisodalis sp. TaxID=3101277 RepID=UPI003B014560
MASTSVRIDTNTHQNICQLAQSLSLTIGETVALAVRRLRQERMGLELRAELTDNERDWLEADLG